MALAAANSLEAAVAHFARATWCSWGLIADLAARGAEAVILGCTEITLLVGPEDSPVPTYDTTALHARAAADAALA